MVEVFFVVDLLRMLGPSARSLPLDLSGGHGIHLTAQACEAALIIDIHQGWKSEHAKIALVHLGFSTITTDQLVLHIQYL